MGVKRKQNQTIYYRIYEYIKFIGYLPRIYIYTHTYVRMYVCNLKNHSSPVLWVCKGGAADRKKGINSSYIGYVHEHSLKLSRVTLVLYIFALPLDACETHPS